MRSRKHLRLDKQQKGQFMTPPKLASYVIGDIGCIDCDILEPSFGNGSFIIELIKKMKPLHNNNIRSILSHIYGVELDVDLYNDCLKNISVELEDSELLDNKLYCADFLLHNFDGKLFDRIYGNPPFGGTIPLSHQLELERIYGERHGKKIKRETYTYFLIKSVELLKNEGILSFICSDTFLTIKTMDGLRYFLMQEGNVSIEKIDEFSDETSYGMVIIRFTKTNSPATYVEIFGNKISRTDIEKTGNFSWGDVTKYSKYFSGKLLKEYVTCTSGMTTGKNEYFVREIVDNKIIETYEFKYYKKPIILKEEISRAHLNKLSPQIQKNIEQQEKNGETRDDVSIQLLDVPITISLPNSDYKFYNKMVKGNIYVNPKYVIYWKDDGKAVKTFKKNGNWYLHGIGGMKFFEREGITWNLIGTKVNPRYLPTGYILDTGCPCAFLNDNILKDELYFIMGWLLTTIANDILKGVINHTRNIQGKDVERLPYPFWVDNSIKSEIITFVKKLIENKIKDKPFDQNYVKILDEWFILK